MRKTLSVATCHVVLAWARKGRNNASKNYTYTSSCCFLHFFPKVNDIFELLKSLLTLELTERRINSVRAIHIVTDPLSQVLVSLLIGVDLSARVMLRAQCTIVAHAQGDS